MPKVQRFTVKVKVQNGVLTPNYLEKKLVEGSDGPEFDTSRIPLKAQEVAEANKGELGIIESFKEDGEWDMEFQQII